MAEVLLLSGRDVQQHLDITEAIDAVEGAFRDLASGAASMPSKSYLLFPRGDLRVMPASQGSEFAGVKVVNSHPENPAQGLPAVMGTYVLVSQETGTPLAIMEATYLTAVRTGAASAVATKYMARKDAASVGLVGSGVQANFQLAGIAAVRDVREVAVWSPPNDTDRRDTFVQKARDVFSNAIIRAVDNIAEVIDADIVVSTTPSREPLLPDSAISNGTHINAVGADGPGKQELAIETLRRSRVIVDEIEQATHGGEINVGVSNGDYQVSEVAGSLAEVVTGTTPGRVSDEEITVFDSTGLAIEDIATAALVYQKALEAGAGMKIEL